MNFECHRPRTKNACWGNRFNSLAMSVVVLWISITGCNRSNSYLATQPGGYAPYNPSGPSGLNSALWQNPLASDGGAGAAAANPPLLNAQSNAAATAQYQEMERRARLLDENNRQLTTQLAQAQQQTDLQRERSDLLQTQLQDAARQLQQAQLASLQTQQEVFAARSEASGLQASIRNRGGATLVANNSLQKTADALSTSGFPAIVDGRVIRIAVPSDQMFVQNTPQLSPAARAILDRIAASLALNASRNRIGVEAHTDAGPAPSSVANSLQQLAALQAVSVIDYMQSRGQFANTQLFSIAHGPNHPVADNQSAAGRAQNRRIEFVVYPDSI